MSLRFGISIPVFILAITISTIGFSQEKIYGPVIQDFGSTFSIPSPDLTWNQNEDLKLIFDITKMSEDTVSLSSQINTIARCINMHANTEVDVERIKMVAVFHSLGTYSILNDNAYTLRYGSENPNTKLLDILSNLGVRLFVCGQSLYSRGVGLEEPHPSIKVALSAMTTLASYHKEGYAIIKF